MKPLKILLIEDVPAEARLIRELISEVARDEACVEQAASLHQGLDALEAGDYDVVLLDLSLPDSYGLETLQQVRAAMPQAAVVVLTGRDQEDIAVKAVEKGAQDYLVKGQVNGRAILRAVRYAMARARALEALRGSQRLFHETPDLLYIINPQSYEIDHLSPAMANLVGSGEGLVQRPEAALFRELIHPDDVEAFEERMSGAVLLPENEVVESEFRILSAEGAWRWLHARETAFVRNADGQVELLIGTAQALQGRHDMEAHMSAQITLLRKVFDALPDPIVVENSSGELVLANAAYRKISGASRDRERAGGEAEMTARQAGRSAGAVRSKPGPKFTLTPVVGDSGEVIGVVAVGNKAS
jgi:PAS domain S-box-containing protein